VLNVVEQRYVSTIYEKNDALNVTAQQFANTIFEKADASNAMEMKYAFINIINTVA